MGVGPTELEYTLSQRFLMLAGRCEKDGSEERVRLDWRQMATKHVPKRPGVRRNPATAIVQAAVHITEDEADILIGMRREKGRRVSFAEVLRKHGYGLKG
jgi:hypothetical protein